MRLMPRLAATAALCLLPLAAPALDTSARAAMVVEHETGTVLLAKNVDTPLPPASMSKLMTLAMLFDALKEGRLSLDNKFRVSAKAAAMQGSSMFLREGEQVTVRDLIPGIIVQSGNDACVVVAEALAGSEKDFAAAMTRRAQELGMTNSTFANASGWPDPRQRMSVRDLVTLARYLIDNFPDDPEKEGDYGNFSQRVFKFDGRVPSNIHNRHPLLGQVIGGDESIVVDGLKTGHTKEAGYGLVASAVRGDRRIVLVITGLPTAKSRLEESERLLSWAFREFRTGKLFDKGQEIATADVWLGEAPGVPLVTAEEITATLPYGSGKKVSARAVFKGPVTAPVEKGQPIGELVIEAEGLEPITVPLLAGKAVARAGFLQRAEVTAGMLFERVLAQF
ncbi:MAG: D-alanyl-D-alanine carboxypeptidase [Alphaproteobacteria bacterium]|nr:MAG: D-alanyl-D-alanine carboxypeptidase [Alphaproteobacteria bacterium]